MGFPHGTIAPGDDKKNVFMLINLRVLKGLEILRFQRGDWLFYQRFLV